MPNPTEHPFVLAVPDDDLALLRKKLDLVRLPDETDGAAWKHGAEADINKLPMFTRDIDVDCFGTLNIHYIQQKSEVIPLLFSHGWPGDFLQVRKMLPLLTEKSPRITPAFMLSLLAYRASGVRKPPGSRASLVVNTLRVEAPKLLLNPHGHLITHLRRLIQGSTNERREMAHTEDLGYGLTDPPVGLLAWIYEKLVDWTDDYTWTDNDVLEWTSVYWFSRSCPAAAGKIYYEMTGQKSYNTKAGTKWMSVPLGVSYFAGEIVLATKSWLSMIGNLVFESEHDKGEHFAAFEQPAKLAGDLWKMHGKGGPAHGGVPGNNGYD
ncbi:Alpha/Beta hydrolase protein [Trametes gibbosa]|nr:Alpha/Beta hydrolase protein [Trametes gibbosa]